MRRGLSGNPERVKAANSLILFYEGLIFAHIDIRGVEVVKGLNKIDPDIKASSRYIYRWEYI